MLYFAYGSNMDPTQIRKRCPSEQFKGIGPLADHRLCFPRESKKRGCGVASIEPHPGAIVWGVVYDLADDDWPRLDECEGCHNGGKHPGNDYNRELVNVVMGNAPTDVVTYVANPQKNPPRPNRDYMSLIIGGACHWGLPLEYLKTLCDITTCD